MARDRTVSKELIKFPPLQTRPRTSRFYLRTGHTAEKQGGKTLAETCNSRIPGVRAVRRLGQAPPWWARRVDGGKYAHVYSHTGPADTQSRKIPFSLSLPWTTATLHTWIVHHMLLQTIQDSLNLAPSHTASMHGLGCAATFLPRASLAQEQL